MMLMQRPSFNQMERLPRSAYRMRVGGPLFCDCRLFHLINCVYLLPFHDITPGWFKR